ncbi:MAG: transglutaminase domain-containing protein [Acidobacteria bacterium]|nr:transglutaminase domain-containing protein [Acidobacteriota bacterium]
MDPLVRYLEATDIIDSDHPDIRAFSAEKSAGAGNAADRAASLYYAVRDGIRYDPYYPFYKPEHYRASNVLRAGRGFCIQKVSLLCAAARAAGIPARAGFATVRNHLATRQLLEFIGTDIFKYHGYTEFFLDGRWVKATPAFNRELCERHGVAPLEFDGREDSMFQPYNADRKKFMEYLEFHGTFADIPVQEIVRAFERASGVSRVRGWIESFEKYGDVRKGLFDAEDPLC